MRIKERFSFESQVMGLFYLKIFVAEPMAIFGLKLLLILLYTYMMFFKQSSLYLLIHLFLVLFFLFNSLTFKNSMFYFFNFYFLKLFRIVGNNHINITIFHIVIVSEKKS